MAGIVQAIGAAAGCAAAVGLTLLSALHFSHARELKRLRDWAARAPEPRTAATAPASQQSVIVPSRRFRPWSSPIGTRYVAVALAGVVVLGGAAAYGVTDLTGGDRPGGQANTGSGLSDQPKRNGPVVRPGNVTVAVLNGTTVPGLAAALSDQMAAAGFKKGAIDVFSDQQLAESVVQYAPGHEAAAKAVSRRVGISRREPVSTESRARAGDANVIVIAGADKAP